MRKEKAHWLPHKNPDFAVRYSLHVCLETCRENADDDDYVVVKGALLILIIQTGILQMYVLCALSVMTFTDIGTDCSNFSL